MSDRPHWWLAWRPATWPVALLGYLALAITLTWPLARHLGDRLPGENQVDAWGLSWNMWWFKRALLTGQNPYYTDLWFAPDGADLFLHTLSPFNSLLGLAPTLLAGPVVAYNLVALATIMLAGQATFLLARHLTGQAGPAFVGGLAFAGSPYLMGHLTVGHLNVAALAWLPLFALALLRAGEGSRRHIPLAAVCLAMTALCEWHTLIFAGLTGGVLIATQALLALRGRCPWHGPARMVAAACLGGLLLAPLIVLTARAVERAGPHAELGERWAASHSANLLAYLLPQDLHPLWGPTVLAWRKANLTEVLTEDRLSLGLVVLALAGLGIAALRWRALPWLAVGGLGLALAVGPALQVGQQVYRVTTPFEMVDDLPFVGVSRTPARFSVLAVLALALLAAAGVGWLARQARRWPAGLVTGLVGLLMLGEFVTAPFDTAPPPDPTVPLQVGQAIAATDPHGTVLTLPYRRAEQERVYDQIYHQRPIFGGFLPRDGERPFRANTPGFADLGLDEPPRDIFEPAPDPVEVLNYFHVRYVLLYRGEILDDGASLRLLGAVRRVLRQPAPEFVAPGRGLEAWRVPVVPADDAFLRVGSGWYPPESMPGLGQARWMGRAATLYLERPEAEATTISLVAYSFDQPRRVEILADGHSLGIFPLTPTPDEITFHLPADEGTTSLEVRSLDGAAAPREVTGARDDRLLSVAVAHVRLTTDEVAAAAVTG